MKVNLDELHARVEQRLISVQKHPSQDLYIYNYTPLVQFSHAWDEYTLMCRGLILDGSGTVVARPFRKFFNLEEHLGALPSEPTVRSMVFALLDGKVDRAAEVAWKALKPAYEKPYKQDIDV